MLKYITTAAALTVASCAPAMAQQCMDTETALEQLDQQFGESPFFMGLTSEGYVLSMHINKQTGTWTALLSSPDGTSCAVADGMSGELFNPVSGDPA